MQPFDRLFRRTPKPTAFERMLIEAQRDWLLRRDTSLPRGALLLVHSIELWPPHIDRQFKLLVLGDGAVHVALRAAPPSKEALADRDFPSEPAWRLPATGLAALRQALTDEGFFDLAPLQPKPPASPLPPGVPVCLGKPGKEHILRARRESDGYEHEVLYGEGAPSGTLALLWSLRPPGVGTG